MPNQHGTKTFDLLVDLTRTIRPAWDRPGVQAAVKASLARELQPTLAELAYALIRCAENPSISTPAVIALDGPHWKKTQHVEPLEPIRARKCQRCSDFHQPDVDCEPVVPKRTTRTSQRAAECRELLRDSRATLCKHGVVPWLCSDCQPTARPVHDTLLPEETPHG